MRLAAVGDNVVDIYLALGMMFPGGNALNVAVGAKRNGLEAAYVGAVGTDRAGALVTAAMVQEGVETTRLRTVPGANAYAEVEVVDGERTFGSHDIGVSRFDLDEADLDYLSGFDCLHTGDCSMLEHRVKDLAAVAPVAFDFSDRPASYCEPLLPLVWVACLSAARMGPSEAESLGRHAAELGPEVVVVSEGSRGALAMARNQMIRVVAPGIAAVDTLGAGDALLAGVLAGLLGGEDPGAALRHGVMRAAETCLHYGAFGHGQELEGEVALRRARTDAGSPPRAGRPDPNW